MFLYSLLSTPLIKMKVTMVPLLCLVFLQATSAAYISEPHGRLQNLDQGNENGMKYLLYRDYLTPDFGRCFKAVREVESVAQIGLSLFKDTIYIAGKATEERHRCQKTTNTPEDLGKCLKTAEDKFREGKKQIFEQVVLQFIPKVKSALASVLDCVL